jgi:glycosyltransferase involved in cell wall biosynthesis
MSTSSPAVSAILLSYNCQDFIAEAVQSVLAQDCEPMEVLISDDASSDRTFEILESKVASYDGPHEVSLRRRSKTSGSKSAHLNDAFERVSGEIIVSFDDDDISDSTRVRRIVGAFEEDRAVQAVFSSFSLINASGRSLGRGKVPHPPPGMRASTWFAKVDAYAAGTTLSVRRPVIERFGPLDPDIHEDVLLPFRASLLGEVRYIDEELVQARRRSGSLTANMYRFESIENYRTGMQRGIEQARKQLDSRIADLEHAVELMPERRDEFAELERLAHASMAQAEVTAALVDPSLFVRMRALLKLIRSGAYREELPQNLCLTFVPELYLRYKRRALGIAKHES